MFGRIATMTIYTAAMQDDSSTIASWARFVILGLQAQGVETDSLLREAGMSPTQMENPNQRIEVSQMTRLWQAAGQLTGDPCFTLRLAERAQPDMFSGLGLAIAFSDNIGEAIQRICRFSTVASSAANLEAVAGPEGSLEVIYRLNTPIAGEAIEAFMACGGWILKQISQDRFKVKEVHFCHDKSVHRDQFEAFFQAPVFFNAPVYKFVLDKNTLELPCYQSNPDLARNIENWMAEYLASIDAPPLAAKVRRLLLENIMDGVIDQVAVADRLAMSTRALQRGLKQEGLSFRELLESTRRDLAEKFLRQPELSLTEICYLLGFSDQSNFTKAFKRWTGETPASYRQAILH